jgi:hypothetical protein
MIEEVVLDMEATDIRIEKGPLAQTLLQWVRGEGEKTIAVVATKRGHATTNPLRTSSTTLRRTYDIPCELDLPHSPLHLSGHYIHHDLD